MIPRRLYDSYDTLEYYMIHRRLYDSIWFYMIPMRLYDS